MTQREFLTHSEAVERIGGDAETLRQILLTGDLRPYVELSRSYATYYPSSNTSAVPMSGSTRHARWLVLRQSPENGKGLRTLELTGWFLVHRVTVRPMMRGDWKPDGPWSLVVTTEDDAKPNEIRFEARLSGYAREQFWFRTSDIDRYQTATSASTASNEAKRVFDTRERSNFLRVIRALSVLAKLPDRGAVASVEAQLQELGFQSPKEATIRKLLAEARELDPD